MPIAQKQATTAWPDGSTWVFQGTIAEDATAGTHVCSLTVTPGVGNEMEVLYGQIKVGATATAQTAAGVITDGTNDLSIFYNPQAISTTTSGLVLVLGAAPSNAITSMVGVQSKLGLIVSGTQTLILRVTTAAVSVTQAFSLVCRLRSPKKPTATLLDTIGTSTNTVNTNAIFG